MSDLRTAAQQALGRLRMYYYGTGFAEDAECIAALEAALAQQEEPVEPVQEPEGLDWRYTARIGYVVKPYTAPPQRKPLTEEEIEKCFRDAGITIKGPRWTNAVRNVERAHGIVACDNIKE